MNEVKISLLLRTNWSVLSVCAGILPLLGHAADDFVSGRLSLRELIHPDDSDFAEVLFAADSSLSSGVFSLRLRQADGQIRCVRACYTRAPARDNGVMLELRLQDARSLPRTLDDASLTANFQAMMENTDDFIYYKGFPTSQAEPDRGGVRSTSPRNVFGSCGRDRRLWQRL